MQPAFCVALVPRACATQPRTCPSIRDCAKTNHAVIPEGASPSPLSLSDRLSNLKFGYEDVCPLADQCIRYQCRNGHVVTVRQGTPACARCPTCVLSECGRGAGRLCVRKLQITARERGGELLSTVYLGARERLLWRCARGHVWAATADNVRRRGSWCPHCALSGTIEQMRELAAGRGGECISEVYAGAGAKLRWRCKRGHEFEQTPNNAFRRPGGRRKSSWCKICAKIDTKRKKELAVDRVSCDD